MTNGDRIRQMSNEELAEFALKHQVFCTICANLSKPECILNSCKEGIKAYLDKEEE